MSILGSLTNKEVHRVLTAQQRAQQLEVIQALGVQPHIDIDVERQRREQFIVDYVRATGSRALVLGISGGVDSLLVGLIAQHAVHSARAQGIQVWFHAMRLPYGTQHDAQDALAAVACIAPDYHHEVNIQPATDALVAALEAAQGPLPAAQREYIIGNVKARQRMIVQYTCAAAHQGLVLGSDHAAEAVMGYFTKYGDGAADLMPLAGLTKTQVRALAQAYGAPEHLVNKVPTADLESDRPLLPDEEAFGISYADIDAFLTGQAVSASVFEIIMQHYRGSAHKRQLPAHP